MSRAKIFAFMKKREGQAGRQDVHRVCKSKRDLFNGSQCAVVWTLLLHLCCLSCHLTHFAQMDSISLVIHPHPRLPL